MLADLRVSLASIRKCRRALSVSVMKLEALEVLPGRVPSGVVKKIIREAFKAQGFGPDALTYRARFDRMKTVAQALSVLRPALRECQFAAKGIR